MHVLIVANGAPADLPAQDQLPEVDLTIAADGGAANARRLGLQPSIVIGDMDSIDATDREELEAAGLEFITHPAEKDATDLELATRYAVEEGAQTITIVGALGGRPDQTLANVLLLARPFLDDIEVHVLGAGWEGFYVRGAVTFRGRAGDVVSLLPLTPEVAGVTTTGLYWALNDDSLLFGSTLGVSNEMLGEQAQVSIREGVLLVIHTLHSSN